MVFNNDLEYQNDAIASVMGLFTGQETVHNMFTIYDPVKYKLFGDSTGIANKLNLDNEELLKNINSVCKTNHQKPLDKLTTGEYNFAIEMETGTGKTFVYLKTIFEMCKKFGFKKFIILVPSVAIKEGVLSSLRMLSTHFDYHYKDFPFHYFQYSSEKLSELMEFARSDQIEIMVMTIQSLDSDNKVLNSNSQKHLEKTNGLKPIDVINRCNPIVIIDEPQSTSSSQSRKNHIKSLNPLCTLQYSATHKDEKKVHKIYRLTAVDAYIKKLVKQIEVASVIPKNDHNYAYVKLIEVKSAKTKITAKIELDVLNNASGNVERKVVTANPHGKLFDLSGSREMYTDMIVESMRIDGERESITISGREIVKGEEINTFDVDIIKRTQIRKTIEEHFYKEERLNLLGIKVLSLFFIDKVCNYRSWDGDTVIDGKFYQWFEEEYEIIRRKYSTNNKIKAIDTPVEKVHQGYFAEDNKKHFKNTKGDSADDIKAYESIMKDKESLLNFDNPIRFIFSHSALREGWDNPNVFQICTLNESAKSNDRKRQEIGRGLRLCVNQNGERVYGFEINTLTVMANQSYEDFAKGLQTEIEKEGGFKFGAIEPLSFATIDFVSSDEKISAEKSNVIYEFCREKNYIDVDGNVTDTLKSALCHNKLEVPQDMEKYKWDITEYFKKVCGNINIKPKSDPIKYRQNKHIVAGPYFLELWNRIKDKTKYSVQYETSRLIDDCANKIRALEIGGVEVEYRKAKIIHNTTGIEGTTTFIDYENIIGYNRYLPDIISFLQNATNLTRKTIVEIIKNSQTLHMFYSNPQRYMSEVANEIKKVLLNYLTEGIVYKSVLGSEYYLHEVFPDEEITNAIEVLVKSDNAVYEYVYCESKPEKDFAEALNKLDNVMVYAKLPTRKFVVPTPVGEYTPDWAVVLKEKEIYKLYFVVETKSTLEENERRDKENKKIYFGRKRFEQVGGAGYILATNSEDFMRESKKYYADAKKTKRKL